MRRHDALVPVLRVFVSSPGDVQAEREILDEVVQAINDTTDHVRLELVKWERNVVPQIGPPAQTVVDQQTPSYGVYLGIMAHRFGTPTGPYGSGTEKEFRSALAEWARLGSPWILFYFNDGPVSPSQLDLAQYGKVRAFREELMARGLFASYSGVRGTREGFFETVGQHLRLLLRQMPALRSSAAGPPAGGTASPEPPAVPRAYRAWLQAQCGDIELRGLRVTHGRSVRLEHVYVPLTTPVAVAERQHERQDDPPRPHLLLDCLGKRSLYVSGAPGTGKSIFCRWVTWLACAGAMPRWEIEAPEAYAETLDVSLRDRLPLLVRLRDFWTFLPGTPGVHELSRAELEGALARWVGAKRPPDLEWATVRAHVERGSALLIFDGVDEVPLSRDEGRQMSHPRSLLVDGLVAAVPEWVELGNRVLLTSRPHGLTGEQVRRLGIPRQPVEDLTEEAQALLVRRWFHLLAHDPSAGEATAREMLEHVRERGWLESLTGNPMLLTATCIVYAEGKRLPHDKHDLYVRIVDNVLHNRYSDDPREIDLVRGRLGVIAHGMHTGAGLGDARSTPRAEATYDEIERMIQSYREQSPWTEAGFTGSVEAREDLLSRSGLLLPREDRRAGFYHLSIQEFLAAARLVDLEGHRLPEVFGERAISPEWRPALGFAFGALLAKSSTPERSIRLLTRLVEVAAPETVGLQVVIAECVEILLGRGIRLDPAVETRVRSLCSSAIEREVPTAERHVLGLTLGRLGDPRIVCDLRDRAAYVSIEARDYLIGDDRRRFTLTRPLDVSRYPVTNSQYARFVTTGGYEEAAWWSERGRRWLRESGAREPGHWRRSKWNNPNQPVVGVSFWEAEACCVWAGGRLPTADESECAARGPDALEYPWGDAWRDGICNTQEAGLGMTSAVGLFPQSRSIPHGLEDMAGNVLEWCRAASEASEDVAVLRGGAWDGTARLARAGARSVDHPDVSYDDAGFRVVRAPDDHQ